jgi:hypothetical protein
VGNEAPGGGRDLGREHLGAAGAGDLAGDLPGDLEADLDVVEPQAGT